jgi:ABC-type branched-subunit amino acid transport system ATPase component
VVLAAGRTVAEGSVAEVADSDLVREAYLGTQRL